MENYTTYEVCPHCGEEVELNAELAVQTCPNCGKRIVACSMCRATDANDGKNYCSNCCLCYQAEAENLEAVAYQAEKKALVDSALASIKENGPYEAGNPAPVVSTSYFGEKIEERILEVFIGEDSGQVLVNSAPYCEEERHELTPLADYGNDEIRAILRAVGINVKL